MTTLTVKNYFTNCTDTAQAGNAFFVDACKIINQGETILFDMSGQDSVSTVFLNASIGQLIDTFGIEKVKRSFRFASMLRSQAERIKKYFADYAEMTNRHQ